MEGGAIVRHLDRRIGLCDAAENEGPVAGTKRLTQEPADRASRTLLSYSIHHLPGPSERRDALAVEALCRWIASPYWIAAKSLTHLRLNDGRLLNEAKVSSIPERTEGSTPPPATTEGDIGHGGWVGEGEHLQAVSLVDRHLLSKYGGLSLEHYSAMTDALHHPEGAWVRITHAHGPSFDCSLASLVAEVLEFTFACGFPVRMEVGTRRRLRGFSHRGGSVPLITNDLLLPTLDGLKGRNLLAAAHGRRIRSRQCHGHGPASGDQRSLDPCAGRDRAAQRLAGANRVRRCAHPHRARDADGWPGASYATGCASRSPTNWLAECTQRAGDQEGRSRPASVRCPEVRGLEGARRTRSSGRGGTPPRHQSLERAQVSLARSFSRQGGPT